MNEEELIKEKNRILILLKKQEKKALSRIVKAEEELALSLRWKEAEKEGDLLKANFQQLRRGMKSIAVTDWEDDQERTILLNPKLQPQQEVALRYHQSKKRQKAIPYLEKYIQKLKTELEALSTSINHLETSEKGEILEGARKFLPSISPVKEKVKKEIRPALPYIEFISKTGQKIWVGKSASDNEKLTFQIAHGSDWWLHAHGCPGSHVIIRTDTGQDPDAETVQQAAELALKYSKAKHNGEGEVCVTQQKYVTRYGKNQVGKVQVSKHKLIYARVPRD